MVRRFFRQVRGGLGGGGIIVVQRAAQVPFGLAAFFGEQDRRQQPPAQQAADQRHDSRAEAGSERRKPGPGAAQHLFPARDMLLLDRKSTRLNSSHVAISYAVFCLKKKKHTMTSTRLHYS